MKVRFWLSIGYANATHEEEFETEALGYSEEEWKLLSDEEKDDEALLWANNYLDLGYKECEE
jgi:hypothetical protein